MALTCIKWISAACARPRCGPAQCPAAPAATDADVLAASDAARAATGRLSSPAPRFAGHVLESYPAFWLLSGSLERADPREVQRFLATYSSRPLAEPCAANG
jgi:hypothetical protein